MSTPPPSLDDLRIKRNDAPAPARGPLPLILGAVLVLPAIRAARQPIAAALRER